MPRSPEFRHGRRKPITLRPDRPNTAKDAVGLDDSFVLPDHKICYVPTPKNAFTSTLWLLAGLSGQNVGGFTRGLTLAPTAGQAVHRRDLWRGVFTLDELSTEERDEISPSNGWLVFSIVRDPRIRTWSAWQSKFLVGNPIHSFIRFPDRPWRPRVPARAEDVVEDFARFVQALPDDTQLMSDHHFSGQVGLLREDLVPYSALYEITDTSTMVSDLRDHVESLGLDWSAVVRRENETPLPASPRSFPPGIRSNLERIYAGDLDRFGHLWDFDEFLRQDDVEWNPAAYRDIASRVAMSSMISETVPRARAIRDERNAMRKELRRTRRRVDELSTDLGLANERLAIERAKNRRLAERNRAVESALKNRSLRGFPRAAYRRMRRIMTNR